MTTESRKAYLASISREERKVRQQLAYMRSKMFEFKKNACESRELIKKLSAEQERYIEEHEAMDWELRACIETEQERLEKTKAKVNGIKVVIAALKKQLPTTPPCCADFDCCYCRELNKGVEEPKYCMFTGQKKSGKAAAKSRRQAMKELTLREGLELIKKLCHETPCKKCLFNEDDDCGLDAAACTWDIDAICEAAEKLRGEQE